MNSLLIRGGKVVNPEENKIEAADLWIEDGKIFGIFPGTVPEDFASLPTLKARGLYVAPGLIDAHAHLRQPGEFEKETIATGTRAAVAGGVTSLLCMPNTIPPIDRSDWVRWIRDTARSEGVCSVHPVAAVSRGLDGRELTEMLALAEAGAVAFSDDGKAVDSGPLMRQALVQSLRHQRPIISHCQDSRFPPRSREAEWRMVERDLRLAQETGGRLHLAHLSLRESVRLVREAKGLGVQVTAEACPHHFTLTQEAEQFYGANAKMYPPLRFQEDLEAIREGLADGTIDCIASDHAPHTAQEKSGDFEQAPNGIIGLETLLSLTVTFLVSRGALSLLEAFRKLSLNPARIFGFPGGRIRLGAPADLVVFDLEAERKVERFYSKSRNSPFLGWELQGAVRATLVGGKIVHREGI